VRRKPRCSECRKRIKTKFPVVLIQRNAVEDQVSTLCDWTCLNNYVVARTARMHHG
jgi:hypothetical protein